MAPDCPSTHAGFGNSSPSFITLIIPQLSLSQPNTSSLSLCAQRVHRPDIRPTIAKPVIKTSQSALPSATSLPGYPETSFLDSARLVTFSTDAADATAMYMFLMLYRQLVFFDTSPRRYSSSEMPKVTESDLSQLKMEIRDIASCHLGYCFTR